MARSTVEKPPSLAQHFDAPDGFVGSFGWLCGYSADAAFLDDAVERFSRRTRAQRAYEGRPMIALLLDPGNPQILPSEVPALLHLPFGAATKPFSLLHAKVALLGFRAEADPTRWCVRLIVSTGNWTRQTLEESLDLAWRVDVASDRLDEASTQRSAADVAAAWSLLAWLRPHFDERALRPSRAPNGQALAGASMDALEAWMTRIASASRGSQARFLDNRQESLLKQLPSRIAREAGRSARNCLVMGSGFFESRSGTPEAGGERSVLQTIVRELQADSLLTRNPRVDIFVNPSACQSVASGAEGIRALGWSIRAAAIPAYFGTAGERALHAKFLFGANCRQNSIACGSAWVYLGSGNLTNPGFVRAMSPSGGNLEAGVLVAAPGLVWEPTGRGDESTYVGNLLPVRFDEESLLSGPALTPGDDMPERDTGFKAAPIPFLTWEESDGSAELVSPVSSSPPLDVMQGGAQVCERSAPGRYRWSGEAPRQVQVRWRDESGENDAIVPVIDSFGRCAASLLQPIDIDEAWWALANFPAPPDEADLPAGSDSNEVEEHDNGVSRTTPTTGTYPIRQVMQLVENIADRQVNVHANDWSAWCTRLEQTLVQARDSESVRAIRELRVDPISPLWHPAFRPDFAATTDCDEGQRYEEALRRIQIAWKTSGLDAIGEVR